VRLEIVDNEAEVIRRVFEMYALGASLATIAKRLNAEGVVAPQPPRTRQVQAWCPSSIREMLRNERYRGVLVWNRTRKERNPETGRKTSRPRPQSEWMRVEVPGWRIIPEELWKGVESQIDFVNKRFGARSLGGAGRMGRGPRYLFSGFIYCGLCGSEMIIVSGNGRRGYVKYGCPSHRYRGVCKNATMIRRDRLEEQLLSGLEQRVLKPEMINYAFTRFQTEVQRRLKQIKDEAMRAGSGLSALQQKRKALKGKAANVAEAIAAMGHSPSLLTQLGAIEGEIAKIDDQISSLNQPQELGVSYDDLSKFFYEKASELREALRADVETARKALAKHIQKLVLTPKETSDGPIFEVSRDVEIFDGTDNGGGVCSSNGGQGRNRTADASLFRAALDEQRLSDTQF
jgi:site-specific DNA recombinase